MALTWTNDGDAAVSMYGILVQPGQTIQLAENDPLASSGSSGGGVPTTRTVNGHPLSSDIDLTTADIADSSDKRYCTDAQKIVIAATSGTNTGDSATPAETTTTIGALINSATAKTAPVDADYLGLMDSESSNPSNILKKLSLTYLKSVVKTYLQGAPLSISATDNTNPILTLTQSGTGDTLKLIDGSTTTFEVNHGGGVALASVGTISLGTQQVISRGAGQLTGTLVVGDGGANLTHASAVQGYYNTFVGLSAGAGLTSGYGNTYIGQQAGTADNTGFYNTVVGYVAGRTMQGCSFNTFVGYGAGYATTNGRWNTFIGYCGIANTTGLEQVFVGYAAGQAMIDGQFNCFVGVEAGQYQTHGLHNTYIGNDAAQFQTSGNENTYIGNMAGGNTTCLTGSGNVFLGYMAGQYESGSSKFFVDDRDRTDEATSRTSSLIYGVFATAVADQRITFNTGIASVNGSLGIGTLSPATKFQVVDTAQTSPRGIMSSQYNTDVDGARFHMRKARGTLTSPTIIVTGDTLGKLVASGYDGANYLEMGTIAIEAEGTIASTRVPTRIVFSTATDAAPSQLTERMRIDSAGVITFPAAGSVKVGTQQVLSLGAGQLTGNLVVGDGGASLTHSAGDDGYYNTITGVLAGHGITSGNRNFFGGYKAGYINTSYHDNVNVGSQAGMNILGNGNVMIGSNTGYASSGSTWVNYNTFVGQAAGYSVAGSGNVFLGYSAGYYETGNNKLFIDNTYRASEADGRLKALIYGVFASTVAAQSVVVNGTLSSAGRLSAEVVYPSNQTLTAQEVAGNIVTNYGMTDADLTFILPAASAGMHFIFVAGVAQATRTVRFDPNASEAIYLDGTALTGGYQIKTTAATVIGDSVEFWTFKTGASAWAWYARNVKGTWITNGS